MIDFVEESRKVDAYDIITARHQMLLGLGDGSLCPPVRAEAMTARMKAGLEGRLQYLVHCLLDPAVDAIGNSQISRTAPWLGDFLPPDFSGPVAPGQKVRPEWFKETVSRFQDFLSGHSIGAWCALVSCYMKQRGGKVLP